MPLPATILFAWSAIHAYVALFHGLLYLRRRSGREHRSFAWLSVGFALVCGGAAWAEAASSSAAGTAGARLGALGLAVVCGAAVDLCARLGPAAPPRLVPLAGAWAVI